MPTLMSLSTGDVGNVYWRGQELAIHCIQTDRSLGETKFSGGLSAIPAFAQKTMYLTKSLAQ